uniref:Putative LOC101746914 [Bombyx mori] n=1 Tax=Lepeophtheirus salmonis TaxID=72036 RepID=A0A0K2VEE7_LEPSM
MNCLKSFKRQQLVIGLQCLKWRKFCLKSFKRQKLVIGLQCLKWRKFRKQDRISLRNCQLFWGILLIVQTSIRRMYLYEIHLNHRGIAKMKMVARNFI